MRRVLIASGVMLCALGGLYAFYFWNDGRLREFELRLHAQLPRCFSPADLGSMAKALSSNGVRCRPAAISLRPNDPFPEKLLCMPAARFPEEGPYEMKPPVLVLTVDQGCLVSATH